MEPLVCSVQAVLFDLDGTLVETNIDFAQMRREMVALASKAGVNAAQVAQLDILSIVELAASHVSSSTGPEAAEEFKTRAWSVLEEIEMAHACKAQPMPYSCELLAELTRRGIKTAVVTRNSRRASQTALRSTLFAPPVVICREDTLRFKPHPDPLKAALRVLGADPKYSIMVGDHLMDIESGKRAGMKTIGFLGEHRPDDFFASVRPDFVARNLREVLCAIIGCDG